MTLINPLAQNLLELTSITENTLVELNWSGAVNMIFVEDCFLFIKRADEMPSHKGQIGLLGGHKQHSELEPKVTAFRELEEESGIGASEFQFLGLSTPVITSGGRAIIPVVSRYLFSKDELINKMISNGEWSHFILVKRDYLQLTSNWQFAKLYRKSEINIYFCPLTRSSSVYRPELADGLDHILWGATAKMVWNLFKNNF